MIHAMSALLLAVVAMNSAFTLATPIRSETDKNGSHVAEHLEARGININWKAIEKVWRPVLGSSDLGPVINHFLKPTSSKPELKDKILERDFGDLHELD